MTLTPDDLQARERRRVIRGGKWVAQTIAFGYHDLRVITPLTIPDRGGGILVCNHTASLDPVYLQAAIPARTITWMMAREYRDIWGLDWFFRAIDPILVERSGKDMAATRAALRALKDGKLIGLFPEGRIAPTRQLLEFQTGVALLAIKAGVPVYPAYLDGTQRGKSMVEGFFMPNRSTLAFGPPLTFEAEAEAGREGLDTATARIKQAVEALARLREYPGLRRLSLV